MHTYTYIEHGCFTVKGMTAAHVGIRKIALKLAAKPSQEAG